MRTLIADDDRQSRSLLQKSLEGWGHTVECVSDGAAAAAALLSEGGPRLALLDWMMPGLDGIGVIQRVRSAEGLPHRHLIILTAKTSNDDIVTALDAGANDCLTKPWHPQELRARLRVGARMIELHEALEAANEALGHLARTDDLTQVMNRKALMERLEEELARCMRGQQPLGVLLLDVDRFKEVNDTHGHQAGDAVLKEIASRLQQICRPYDMLGRYGGEEFLALFPGAPREGMAAIRERTRSSIGGEAILAPDGTALQVTISGGQVWLAPGAAASVDGVIQAADRLLYAAKAAGRDQVLHEDIDGIALEGA